jgi:hypothetical protein
MNIEMDLHSLLMNPKIAREFNHESREMGVRVVVGLIGPTGKVHFTDAELQELEDGPAD